MSDNNRPRAFQSWIAKSGLGNIESPDLSDLTSPAPQKVNVGFCHSHACTGGDLIGRPTIFPGQKKDRCPKCMSENIFWKQMTKSHLEATKDKWKAYDKARAIKQEENRVNAVLDDARNQAKEKWHKIKDFTKGRYEGDFIGSCIYCNSYHVEVDTRPKGSVKEIADLTVNNGKCGDWFNSLHDGDRRIILRQGKYEIDEIVSVQSNKAVFRTLEEKFNFEVEAKKFLSQNGFKKISRTTSGFRKLMYLLKMKQLGEIRDEQHQQEK